MSSSHGDESEDSVDVQLQSSVTPVHSGSQSQLPSQLVVVSHLQ